jgi:hypothetical protein
MKGDCYQKISVAPSLNDGTDGLQCPVQRRVPTSSLVRVTRAFQRQARVGRARAKKSPLLLLQLPHPPMAPSARSSAMQLSMPVALSCACFNKQRQISQRHGIATRKTMLVFLCSISPKRSKNLNRSTLLSMFLLRQERTNVLPAAWADSDTRSYVTVPSIPVKKSPISSTPPAAMMYCGPSIRSSRGEQCSRENVLLNITTNEAEKIADTCDQASSSASTIISNLCIKTTAKPVTPHYHPVASAVCKANKLDRGSWTRNCVKCKNFGTKQGLRFFSARSGESVF